MTSRKLNSVPSQASMISVHSCSSHHREKKEVKKTKRKKRNRVQSQDAEQRVRFSDSIQQVSPDNKNRLPKTAIDYENLENYDHVDETGETETTTTAEESESNWAERVDFKPDVVESESKKKKQKRPKSIDDFRIPELGVNIHREAYILALKDAQMGLTKKKGKKGKKNKAPETARSEPGTVFSYFPLLPQPASSRRHKDKDIELGLRQREGANVKLKNTMKHIFGGVKWDDYYPGGSRWKKMVWTVKL